MVKHFHISDNQVTHACCAIQNHIHMYVHGVGTDLGVYACVPIYVCMYVFLIQHQIKWAVNYIQYLYQFPYLHSNNAFHFNKNALKRKILKINIATTDYYSCFFIFEKMFVL